MLSIFETLLPSPGLSATLSRSRERGRGRGRTSVCAFATYSVLLNSKEETTMKVFLHTSIFSALMLATGTAHAHAAHYAHDHAPGAIALLIGVAVAGAVWLALDARKSIKRARRDKQE
jgi:hypothetical protein